MPASPEIVEATKAMSKSFVSWSTWWPIIKALWPLWLLGIFVFIFRNIIEPKIFRKIDRWKKIRNQKRNKPPSF